MIVYPAWAFTKDADEKSHVNYKTYEALRMKYKIAWERNINKGEETDYDIIIRATVIGYTYNEYTVVKKPAEVTDDEIALICDSGNLSFGYVKTPSGDFHIYTD